jgi:hypothetical protein
MSRTRLLNSLCLSFLLAAAALGQTERKVAPVPGDPLELATGPARVVDAPEERASVLSLVERARQNNNLHMQGGAPYELKVSFNVMGQTPYNGVGELSETWAAPGMWRWSERLGSYTQERVFHGGVAYDTNPQTYQPLRLQLVREAIFWPVAGQFASRSIRVAQAQWQGKPVTCVLVSAGRARDDSTSGRRWEEEEFCIDQQTGLLQTYSIAPGLYNVYDYGNAVQFHGHTVARQFSIVENGSTVVQAQVESLSDLGAVDASAFTPAQGMRGPGAIIREPVRFPQVVKGSATVPEGTIQPVVVLAALDASGKVLEAEALQTSDPTLSEEALRLVRSTNYGPTRGAVPLQREFFIRVQFMSGQ